MVIRGQPGEVSYQFPPHGSQGLNAGPQVLCLFPSLSLGPQVRVFGSLFPGRQLVRKARPERLSSQSLPLFCGAAFQVASPGSQLCWCELRAEQTCWGTVSRPVWLEEPCRYKAISLMGQQLVSSVCLTSWAKSEVCLLLAPPNHLILQSLSSFPEALHLPP